MEKVKRRRLLPPERIAAYKTARFLLGHTGRRAKGLPTYIRMLSPQTTLSWQRSTLQETVCWMFEEWRRVCKENPTRNHCHAMLDVSCLAFGVAQSDMRSKKCDVVIKAPRELAVLMLWACGYTQRAIGWSFNRSVEGIVLIRRRCKYARYLEFMNDESNRDGRPAFVRHPTRSVSNEVHGRVSDDSGASQT